MPLFVRVVLTVVVPVVVNVLPLATVNTFCVIFLAVEKLSKIFVVPAPVIAEVNALVPDKFNIPSFAIAFVIFKLPAATFTVPELIVKSFWEKNFN